jgi:hypothetical protein
MKRKSKNKRFKKIFVWAFLAFFLLCIGSLIAHGLSPAPQKARGCCSGGGACPPQKLIKVGY